MAGHNFMRWNIVFDSARHTYDYYLNGNHIEYIIALEDGIWNIETINFPVAVFGETLEKAQDNLFHAMLSHLEVIASREGEGGE